MQDSFLHWCSHTDVCCLPSIVWKVLLCILDQLCVFLKSLSNILTGVNTCIFNLLGDYKDSNVTYMNLLQQMTPPRKNTPQRREKREKKQGRKMIGEE